MNEDRATRYHRLKRRAGLASTAWCLVLLAGLLVTGGSVVLRDAAASVAAAVRLPGPAMATTAGFSVALFLLLEAGTLPAAFYSGFILERRYGLSVETARSWLREHTKSRLLALVLAVAAAIAVYEVMGRWPGSWWLITAAGFSIALAALTAAAPVLILPLFYRVAPLGRPPLEERLMELASRAGVGTARVFRLDLGRPTLKANAVLAGIGPSRRILLSDRLLEDYTDDEIEAIVAHEIGHVAGRDVWLGVLLETLVVLAAARLADAALRSLGPGLGVSRMADVAGLPLLVLVGLLVSLALAPFARAFSRARERRADAYGMDLSGKPGACASAIRRLAAHNLAEPRPSRLVQLLYYTHPPAERRIEAAMSRPSATARRR